MTQVTADDKRADKNDAKERVSGQIWAAVITALATIVVGLITLYGTLRVTDSRIVTGPEMPGPTVTRTVTVAPTAPVPEPPEPTEPGPDPTTIVPDKVHLDTTWETEGADGSRDVGDIVQFDCPPRGIPQQVIGTGLYAGWSSVCTAAVHDGRITLKKGGRVFAEMREGAPEYKASRQHGITSEEWGEYASSFEFLPAR